MDDLDALLADTDAATDDAFIEPSAHEGETRVSGTLVVLSTSPDAEPLNETIADAGRRLAAIDWSKKAGSVTAGKPRKSDRDSTVKTQAEKSEVPTRAGHSASELDVADPSQEAERDVLGELEDLLD